MANNRYNVYVPDTDDIVAYSLHPTPWEDSRGYPDPVPFVLPAENFDPLLPYATQVKLLPLQEDLLDRHVQLNHWLEIQCYWYYVIGRPQFSNAAYDLIYRLVEQDLERDAGIPAWSRIDPTTGIYLCPARRFRCYGDQRYDVQLVETFKRLPKWIDSPAWSHEKFVEQWKVQPVPVRKRPQVLKKDRSAAP